MKYLVSRHAGAIQWCQSNGTEIDKVVTHLEPGALRAGDCVYGTLPLQLVEQICVVGGRYFHLCLDMPENMRGKELTVDMMNEMNARFEEFRVGRVSHENP